MVLGENWSHASRACLRMRRGILREMEKARADKKAESVAEQKKSWNEWKEAKKAENRRKREGPREKYSSGQDCSNRPWPFIATV
uniref:Uncharacterized protein n=1 Tax=Magallana gigas TaxID=29159 RepID=K1RNC9_MAGGI